MTVRRRLGAKTGTAVLTAGLVAGAMVALAGPADAAACSGLSGLAGSCTTGGTITIGSGGLSVGGPASLAWSASLSGQAQTVYDTSASADETLYASDLRGLISTNSGSGWKITASAGPFTGTATSGNATIPDITAGQVLAFGGGTAGAANNTPSTSCVYIVCGAPADSVTYPLFVPTGTSPTPAKIYNAGAGTGTGVIQVGGSSATHPAVWSIAVPAGQPADTYTSTVTLTIAAGPL